MTTCLHFRHWRGAGSASYNAGVLARLTAALLSPALLLAAPSTQRPRTCDSGPHCVSSLQREPAKDARYLPPIPYTGSPEDAQRRLLEVLAALPRVRIAEVEPGHVHALFVSPLLRFKDDADFFLPPGEAVIHFRSSSRIGYYDFGVNRRRIERVRRAFAL